MTKYTVETDDAKQFEKLVAKYNADKKHMWLQYHDANLAIFNINNSREEQRLYVILAVKQ